MSDVGSWRVTLVDRGGTSFPVRPGQTILAAAEEAGVAWISGCRAGACRTCAARLVKGRVRQAEGTSLTPELLAANLVLACVATVEADTELVVGRPGRTLLHPRHLLPWTE